MMTRNQRILHVRPSVRPFTHASIMFHPNRNGSGRNSISEMVVNAQMAAVIPSLRSRKVSRPLATFRLSGPLGVPWKQDIVSSASARG